MRTDYQDDMRHYRETGTMETSPELCLSASNIYVGESLFVSVTGSFELLYVSFDQSEMPVRPGVEFSIAITEVKHYRLMLKDVNGKTLDSKLIKGLVIVPEFKCLNIPNEITYESSRIDCSFTTKNTEQAILGYQVDNGDWVLINCEGSDHSIPIPGKPCEIHIRIELLSKHAEFSDRAKLIIDRHVTVSHPTPRINHSFVEGGLAPKRFDAVTIKVKAAWINNLSVLVNRDHSNRVRPNSGKSSEIVLKIPTNNVGTCLVEMEYEDLDGNLKANSLEIYITVRPVVVEVNRNEKGINYSIKNAANPRFVVPSRSINKKIPKIGLIKGAALTPTTGYLEYEDDSGAQKKTPLDLTAPQGWAPALKFNPAVRKIKLLKIPETQLGWRI
jgi:hypothetical protein